MPTYCRFRFLVIVIVWILQKKTMVSPTGSCDEGHTWYCSQTSTLFFPDDLCYKTTEYNGLMRQKESQKDEELLTSCKTLCITNRFKGISYMYVEPNGCDRSLFWPFWSNCGHRSGFIGPNGPGGQVRTTFWSFWISDPKLFLSPYP